MEEMYLLKLDGEYYTGYYHGEIGLGSFSNALRFFSKEDIFKEINNYDWLRDEINENYKMKQIISIIE